MIREMRRCKQQLSQASCIEIFERGTSGVLALLGDDDYTYALPISYVYHDSKIYFHGAAEGHKLDAVRKHSKVSFCVIDKDEIIQEKYTSYYASVIAFGTIKIIDEENKKRSAVQMLGEKYSPDFNELISAKADSKIDCMSVLELSVEKLSGKQALGLMTAARQNRD